MSLRVMAGDRMGSPAATRRMAADHAVGRGVFEQVTAGSGAQSTEHQLVGVERGQHDHLGRVRPVAEPAGGLDAVDPAHPNVHQGHVDGVGVRRRLDLVAVGGFCGHLDALGTAQHHGQAGPDQRVVVDDQHPDGMARLAHRRRRQAGAWCPRQPGLQAELPGSGRAKLDPPAAQPVALTESDQAGAASRDPVGLRRAGKHRVADVDDQLVSRGAGKRQPDRLPGGVLAGVGQPFLGDPVSGAAGARWHRRAGGQLGCQPYRSALGRPGLLGQPGQVVQGRLRALHPHAGIPAWIHIWLGECTV